MCTAIRKNKSPSGIRTRDLQIEAIEPQRKATYFGDINCLTMCSNRHVVTYSHNKKSRQWGGGVIFT